MVEINTIFNEDCCETMKRMPDNFVDLVVTSPPYDSLRKYNGYSFDFESIAKELFRVVKEGGTVVWIVGDATIDGSETGTSFKQALYFKDECNFKLHDTMIYRKTTPLPLNIETRYNACFEYMFILVKGKIKTFHVNQVPTKNPGMEYRVKRDNNTSNGGGAINTKDKEYTCKPTKNEDNVWDISPTGMHEYCGHPASFSEQMASKHILSWSNEKDLVYDPFIGSGTVAKSCIKYRRNFIGSEISKDYCDIAMNRISVDLQQEDILDCS